jgi:hypothetical protein
MVDKKFSDFIQKGELDDFDMIPSEDGGMLENNFITYNDLKNQIKKNLLEESTSDMLKIESYIAETDSAGNPINYPKELLYLDGSIKYSTDGNTLIGKFINNIKNIPFYRAYFNIPNDNSSIQLPDLRDRVLRNKGDNCLIYTPQNDAVKIDNLNVNTIVNQKKFYADGWDNTNPTDASPVSIKWAIKVRGGLAVYRYNDTGEDLYNKRFGIDQFNNTGVQTITKTDSKLLTNQWSDRDDLTPFKIVGLNHNHTATSTLSGSTATETRVKSYGVFYFLNISLTKITINNSEQINISDVTGLQTELNNKANNSDITNLDNYLNRINHFGGIYKKSGLNIVCSPGSLDTNITNPIFTNPFTSNNWSRNIKGDSVITDAIVRVPNGIKFNIVPGLNNYGLNLVVRLTGSITGNTNNINGALLNVRRIVDNSLITSSELVETYSNNFNGRSISIPSFVNGNNDTYISNGFYITLTNLSTATFTITAIELLIITT